MNPTLVDAFSLHGMAQKMNSSVWAGVKGYIYIFTISTGAEKCQISKASERPQEARVI